MKSDFHTAGIKIIFMKKIVIVISLTSIIFTGCWTPRWVKKEFKYCFTDEKTGLEALININGYYVPSLDNPTYKWNNRIVPIDTLHLLYVFYNNGFVLKTSVDCFNENTKVPFFVKRWIGDPGGYVVHGDTIKLQYVNYDPGGQVMWGMAEIWFKIIDRNTIQRIYVPDWIPIDEFTMIDRITSRKMDRRTLQIIDEDDKPIDPWYEWIFNFRPLEIKINPEDTWIYNKKWFRCKEK